MKLILGYADNDVINQENDDWDVDISSYVSEY